MDILCNNFVKRVMILFVVLQCTRLVVLESSSFSEKNLKKIAEEDGYGYKYANLTLLKDVCTSFNDKERSYKVEVPIFRGIPSDNIHKFLKLHDFDIVKEWGEIVGKHLPTERENQEKMLREKQFPSGFEAVRENFENKIKEKFNSILQQINIFDKAFFDKAFNVKGLDKLIEKIRKSEEKLMVRSTGKEDTRYLANAGGNHTEPNVTPEPKQILEAIQKVVASYFSNKSLTQRLGAGDASIFDTMPFTPVLIQRMIGELVEQLPKCGVMFTEEVEGGISKADEKDEQGRIKTTAITVIQCAYGHNEGVVNSLVPVDTFYVDSEKNIYPVIRPKTHRMVPTSSGVLELRENGGAIITQPALSNDAVLVLKAFADSLENYYGYPMDVEYVIKEHEKTIYIVQARPITHSKERVEPSYLIDFDKMEHVEGSAIGVVGGAVRFVSNAKNIVVREDIGKALAAYQNKDEVPNTDYIQAIIVGKMAPATSHEATTFRSENKPVICIDNWQKVAEWVKRGAALVVCPQQGLVVKGDTKTVIEQKGLDKLSYSACVVVVTTARK